MNQQSNFDVYLKPTFFIDSDSPTIQEYSRDICRGVKSRQDKAIALYYRVRDDIRYDPYHFEDNQNFIRASAVLKRKAGYCVAKAVLLAAVARAQSIPARLGFADVRNHLVTKRLRDMMDTDLFIYHGYVELYLAGQWVKATPAFNGSLCSHFNVKPLEFDGIHDSIFHEFDTLGQRHMEYVNDRGIHADLPFDKIHAAFKKYYPRIFEINRHQDPKAFTREALTENAPGKDVSPEI
ncbi:Transglutaminase-like superfamily protein [Desulfocicer vacuolatum DSM 3385]|uniref:Transglutaminase-like superfamily protein n=1 Tax=Desulfocicer vacuolatum DSM 3385 TaxID=1121400 RepID=A0A1W2E656_9BACT|nr:transglutaminase family protein [Desulfocicer vacuolatum]SMD05260.1 Transglutaminase-like superfamily protein [Desulfocicer vacuolatum DSM 3385]